MVPLAPKLKVITYHFISYRRKSVFNLVEIQNTFVFYVFITVLLHFYYLRNNTVIINKSSIFYKVCLSYKE